MHHIYVCTDLYKESCREYKCHHYKKSKITRQSGEEAVLKVRRIRELLKRKREQLLGLITNE